MNIIMGVSQGIFDWYMLGIKSIPIKEITIFVGEIVAIQTARNKTKFDLASSK